ncbi:DUF2092 domain-containing protein [Desulfovibrio sulfodismutans]|uniref:DUF2092 domain-containing protein n=1 Tax=Desulfolutivibrio sulfodismutans TaxID=63561 RepID=A0A7K3NH96_9BACT|nr:DUF2092 domain-containing protein [Desulfolutivibrio sulfodismutans]NDY55558.1 DUF2092 domain-containing protein [Desulfolutivibrio sulfodismutans]QLA11461.1 DUF2092 domain-containing protein [Desulfolutivibrio sulfodismutans DSM 3696]
MRIFFRTCLSLSAVFMVLALSLPAQSARKAPAAKVVDPKALAIYEQACSYMAGLKGYAFKADILVDLVYDGTAKIQMARTMDVTVQRPNAFKIVTIGDDVSATSVYDGKTFTLALDDRSLYNQLPASLDNDALVDLLSEKYSLDSPLGDMLRNETCAKVDYLSLTSLGMGFVGQTRCHHLFFQGTDMDWQLWIEEGQKPLLRKMVITEKFMPLAPQFSAVLRDWQFADYAASVFAFTPAPHFTRDENMFMHLKLERQGGGHAVK